MAILWDILIGFGAAIILLALLSLMLTALSECYRKFFDRQVGAKMSRPDLIPALSRFAAVVTIALILGAALVLGIRSVLK